MRLCLRREDLRYYAYFALRDLKSRLEAIGGGATMANVNKAEFSSLPVAIPKGQILREIPPKRRSRYFIK